MLLVSYLFLLWLHLFGSVVPQPWLDLEGYFVSFSFQSAAIVAAFGGKFVLGSSLVSCFLPHLAGFFLVPFQSASIDAASWREVCFWFLLSQGLLWPHLAGICCLFLFSHFFAAHGRNLYWYLFSQHLLMPHLGGRLVFGSF